MIEPPAICIGIESKGAETTSTLEPCLQVNTKLIVNNAIGPGLGHSLVVVGKGKKLKKGENSKCSNQTNRLDLANSDNSGAFSYLASMHSPSSKTSYQVVPPGKYAFTLLSPCSNTGLTSNASPTMTCQSI